MQTFHNDDSGYLKWTEEHDNAFVLHIKSSPKGNASIHRSGCTHIYFPKGNDSYTRRTKVCSESMEELQGWAKKAALDVKECSTCKPYSAK